jgi:hypothetical protein
MTKLANRKAVFRVAAKAAKVAKVTTPAPKKASAKKAAAPKVAKPAITLPENMATMNRTSLTALARKLGMTVSAKFATRKEGRDAITAFAQG